MKYFALMSAFLLCAFPHTARASDIGTLLEAASAAKLVAEYLQVIESLDSKIDRLLDADYKTGVSLFEQAKANPKKADRLIADARLFFTRAAAIEADSDVEVRRHKRALALLGLWACCEATDDGANATLALKKITDIPSEPSKGMILEYQTYQIYRLPSDAEARNYLYTGFAFPFLLQRLLKITNVPTTQEYRDFNKDYDSLLSIQEAVRNKIKPK